MNTVPLANFSRKAFTLKFKVSKSNGESNHGPTFRVISLEREITFLVLTSLEIIRPITQR